ncbi:MAG TPA: choice-of-anchor Q domain-containing protein [Candidatus Acidoferrales bacterium]|nr:choice-of-anchor Q domain-containing protein [Candidatus Acidoferrales bacterium]
MKIVAFAVLQAEAILLPELSHAQCSRYVATTGSNSPNDCKSSSSPCLTIANADSVVSPGDTVCLASGTYPTASFSTMKSGTVSQRIRCTWYPQQWGAVLVGNSTGDGSATWTSNGSYVDIVGFDVTAESSTISPAIGVLNYGKHVRVLGNRVHDFTTPCDGNGGAGIVDGSQTNGGYSQFNRNFVFNIQPAEVNGEPCWQDGTPPPAGWNPPAIYLQSPYTSAMDNLTVNTAQGIAMWHDSFGEMIVSNSIRCSNNNGSPAPYDHTIGIDVGASGTTNNWTMLANNITDDCAYGINEESGTVGTENYYLVNDNYGSTYPMCRGAMCTGQISGNQTFDPLFVNDTGDTSGNYLLQSTSQAVNGGANYSYAPFVDFEGGVRPDTSSNEWDMGAYEYGSSAGTWPWF